MLKGAKAHVRKGGTTPCAEKTLSVSEAKKCLERRQQLVMSLSRVGKMVHACSHHTEVTICVTANAENRLFCEDKVQTTTDKRVNRVMGTEGEL